MPNPTYQLPRDSTMQGIVTQLQNIASRMSSNGSGGGSTVVANPSGTASDDLTSIEIDGTIYDIPSGSGSSYDDTALRALIAAKQDALTPGTGIQISNGTISCTVQGGSGSSSGGGSSSEESGYSITSLYNNDSGLTTVGEITLSDSILDYDDLEFIVGINTSIDHSHQSYRISSKYFYDYFKYGTQHSDDHFMVNPWYDMACGFTLGQNNDPTKINFYDMYAGNSGINTALYSINGIKYGSGGNSVLPSGSGYEATLIYDGSALSSLQSSIELDDRWDNYDALYLTFKFGGDDSTFGNLILKEQLLEALNHIYTAIGSYTSNYVGAHVVNDYKTFNQIYGGGNQQQNIYAVYGINFGSGGSSSSGEPYSRTELFKSSTPQQGVISLSDAIDNYDDIEIVTGWVSASDTASHTERFNAENFVTNFPYVANPTNANPHALLEMWVNQGFSCAVGDDTNTSLQTWGHNGGSGILAVYGIKYGSGSSSPQEEYSTTEKVIGKWIDGKPIYQKTFTINVHTDGKAWVDTGCVIPNIEHIIDWSIVCEDTYVSGAPANIKTCSFRYNNNIQIYGLSDWYLDLQAITVKYTKTTD